MEVSHPDYSIICSSVHWQENGMGLLIFHAAVDSEEQMEVDPSEDEAKQ